MEKRWPNSTISFYLFHLFHYSTYLLHTQSYLLFEPFRIKLAHTMIQKEQNRYKLVNSLASLYQSQFLQLKSFRMKQEIQRIKNHDFTNIDSQVFRNMSSVQTLSCTLGSLKQIKGIMDAGIKFSSGRKLKGMPSKQQSIEQGRLLQPTNPFAKNKTVQYGCQTNDEFQSKDIQSEKKAANLVLNYNQIQNSKWKTKKDRIVQLKQKVNILKADYLKMINYLPVLVQTTRSLVNSFSSSYNRLAQKSMSVQGNTKIIQKQLSKLKQQNIILIYQNNKLRKQCEQWNLARIRRNAKSSLSKHTNQNILAINSFIPFNSTDLSDIGQTSKHSLQGLISSNASKQFFNQTFRTCKKRNNSDMNIDLRTARSASQSQKTYSSQAWTNKSQKQNVDKTCYSKQQQNGIKPAQNRMFKKQRHPLTAIIESHKDLNIQFLDRKRMHNHFKSTNECLTNQYDYQPQPRILRKRSEKKIILTQKGCSNNENLKP